MARIAVLVAHPDDEVLGVGGTILRHVAAGDEVRIHIECNAGLRDQVTRFVDAVDVASRFGEVDLTFGDSDQLGYRVPSFDGIEADLIYTHHPGDLNRDHRLVAEGALVAGRGKSVRCIETLSSTEWGLTAFSPTLYVGIDLAAKLDVLSIYASELRPAPHPRSPEAVAALARFRGSTVNLPAAEAFHVIREVQP